MEHPNETTPTQSKYYLPHPFILLNHNIQQHNHRDQPMEGRGPSSPSSKRRKSSMILVPDDEVNKELTKKSLNVSAGGVFYERASSRRARHRQVLQAHSADAIPLKRKREISTSSSSSSSSKKGGNDDKFQKMPRHNRKVFQDDRETLDEQLEWNAFRRSSTMHDRRLTQRFNNSNRNRGDAEKVAPAPAARRPSKEEVLKKQQLIRKAQWKKIGGRQKQESLKKKKEFSTSERSKLFRQVAARPSPKAAAVPSPTAAPKQQPTASSKGRTMPTAPILKSLLSRSASWPGQQSRRTSQSTTTAASSTRQQQQQQQQKVASQTDVAIPRRNSTATKRPLSHAARTVSR